MQPKDGRFRHDLAFRSGVDWKDRFSRRVKIFVDGLVSGTWVTRDR